MIKYEKGCLITAAKSGQVNILLHQCNAFHVMGAGIAKQIKREFPEAYEVDLKTEKGSRSKLGTISCAWNGEYKLSIINLYGQFFYGRGVKTDYGALRECLGRVKTVLELNPWNLEEIKVGLPLIGCGLGGGDWKNVAPLIEKDLGGYNTTVYCL